MRTYFNTGVASTTQVCVYCHTPHMPAGRTQDPLWNHTLSTQGSYGVYGSSSMNAAPTAMTGSDGSVGSLCMSCHDGTVAVNTLWKQPTDGAVGSTRNALGNHGPERHPPGRDQRGRLPPRHRPVPTDHPVKLQPMGPAALVGQDKGLNPVASVVAAGLPLFTGSSMQCATCHNVHDNQYVAVPAGEQCRQRPLPGLPHQVRQSKSLFGSGGEKRFSPPLFFCPILLCPKGGGSLSRSSPCDRPVSPSASHLGRPCALHENASLVPINQPLPMNLYEKPIAIRKKFDSERSVCYNSLLFC